MPKRDGSSPCYMAVPIPPDGEPEWGNQLDDVLVHLCNSPEAQQYCPVPSQPVLSLWLVPWRFWECLNGGSGMLLSLSCLMCTGFPPQGVRFIPQGQSSFQKAWLQLHGCVIWILVLRTYSRKEAVGKIRNQHFGETGRSVKGCR